MAELSALRRAIEADELKSGFIVPDRFFGGQLAPTSGQVWLLGFTARKRKTVTSMTIGSGAVAAGATPTLCRFGVYDVDEGDNLSNLNAVANDTSLLASVGTGYTRNLAQAKEFVPGNRYAAAFIIVTAAALPNIIAGSATGVSTTMSNAQNVLAPFVMARVAAQADLAASYSAASLIGSYGCFRFQFNA